MKSLLISLLFFLATFNFAKSQGLNGEISFNNSYNQYANAIINLNEYSYFILYEVNSGSFFSSCSLIKVDTLGNIIWDVPLNFPSVELTQGLKIIPTYDNGLLVEGNGYPTCDVAMECFKFLHKYDINGSLLWSKTWIDTYCYNVALSGLSSDSSSIFINYMQSDTSAILQFDYLGNLIDSLPISQLNLKQIQNFGNYEKIGITADTLFGFDLNGNVSYSKKFTSSIQNISILNDTLYLLTSDSIFTFDTNLSLIDSKNVPGYSEFSHLKISNHKIRFLSHDLSHENIITLNHSLQLLDVLVIPESIPENTPKDFSDSHFTAAINYELYEYHSVRHLDYSLKSNQNEIINRTDIGVIDIEFTQVSWTPHSFPGVYDFDIYANVLIKNYGNEVLTDCKLNHYIGMGICSHFVYFEHFYGLNLAPGDSVWLNCGFIHSEVNFLSGTDTLFKEICVYTSQPNFVSDLNVSNDSYCENAIIGFVGINEIQENQIQIYPNPASTFIHLENEDLDNYHYSIYSIQGKLIKEGKFITQDIAISELSKGMYILKLNSLNGGKSLHTRFIKE